MPYIITTPPSEAKDVALGRYMDAWSRLESAINVTIQEILELNPDQAHAIWTAVPTFQSIKLLGAAAKLYFGETGQRRVAKLVDQLTRRNIRRNYIVHGN